MRVSKRIRSGTRTAANGGWQLYLRPSKVAFVRKKVSIQRVEIVNVYVH